MITPFTDIAANTDKFVAFQTTKKGWYSVSIKRDGYTAGMSGDATITIMASNYDDVPSTGVSTNFANFDISTTDVPVTQNIDIPNFGYQYMAVSYKSNGASGTIEVFINEPPA